VGSQKHNLFVLLMILTLVSISYGCLDAAKPHANIEYILIINTSENITAYFPVPLDLPNNTISDLVSLIRIDEKESDELVVSHETIKTEYGYALKVTTNGNVTLKATADYEYLKNHPLMPVGSFYSQIDEPLFFDMSMKTNGSNNTLNLSYWAYLENANNEKPVKAREILVISVDAGEELWSSLKDDSSRSGSFSLKPGWQIINFTHMVGVH